MQTRTGTATNTEAYRDGYTAGQADAQRGTRIDRPSDRWVNEDDRRAYREGYDDGFRNVGGIAPRARGQVRPMLTGKTKPYTSDTRMDWPRDGGTATRAISFIPRKGTCINMPSTAGLPTSPTKNTTNSYTGKGTLKATKKVTKAPTHANGCQTGEARKYSPPFGFAQGRLRHRGHREEKFFLTTEGTECTERIQVNHRDKWALFFQISVTSVFSVVNRS